jgi:hypothetical protein
MCDVVMRYAHIMKRTTVMLPDDVLARLRRESKRRGVSVAEIVREAIEVQLPEPRSGGRLSFFGVGEGGPADASERVDDYVAGAVRKRARRRG